MADRIRTQKSTHGGYYERPWVVYLDGQVLRDGRGGPRRFKTEFAARDAGTRKAAKQPASAGVAIPGEGKPE